MKKRLNQKFIKTNSLHQKPSFKPVQNQSKYILRSPSLHENEERTLKIFFDEEPMEKTKECSFLKTNESLIENSLFNENSLETLKNVINLEEKRNRTRKALFRNRYIRDYSSEYKPKGLTSNKCKEFLF